MKYINIILIAILQVGCASVDPSSQKELSEEIIKSVKNDMQLSDVIAVLENRGFACNEGTSVNPRGKGIYECTRNRGGFLYGCIHRVWFEGMSKNGVISNLEIHQPACASL